ncbi:hypothetical protein ABZY68_21675 [Streptomyces sp. NPDC006482]|uniref:hypothetical protein n=1 Tax=Streptomyces sp. NPDC006482 TaxID=3154306 RepID=UPI0033A6D0D0
MHGKRGAAVAALAMAMAVGVTGCGGNANGTGAAGPTSAAPRPAGAGPLTKAVVQADIDSSVVDAGTPPADPDWAAMADRGRGKGCVIAYMGYGAEGAPAGVPQYEALVRELKERGWEQSGRRKERRAEDEARTVIDVQTVLAQRGWSVTTEYRAGTGQGEVKAMAFDVACAKKAGLDENPVG